MTKGLHVPSEIGKLRKVCLHRPGDELLNLPPDELERLLFDDVPFLEVAQQEHDTFAQILRDQGVEVLYLENLVAEVFDQVKLIPCGGGDPIAASREQWNDGSNTLCVEPGKICVYARNTVTNDVLYKEGLDLLVVPSAELSRGRGGPRCMSMPFWREDL